MTAGVLSQEGRENQIARTEEQRKQHKADQDFFLYVQFHGYPPVNRYDKKSKTSYHVTVDVSITKSMGWESLAEQRRIW